MHNDGHNDGRNEGLNDEHRDRRTAPRPRALPVVAVVLAGGVGQRMGAPVPKQLLKVAGRTILEHSIAVFESVPEIDEIVVLMAPGHLADAEEIVARGGFRKVTAVVEGGASRTESTWRALAAIGDRECDVLLHDAVRPLVGPDVIRACVTALETCTALEVAIPSSDTIVKVTTGPDGEVVEDVPDRATLRRTQTPQGFRLSVIREAYRRAFADPGFAERPATDDCGVVLRYLPDVPIRVVPGSEHNLKITHPVDVAIAERLFELTGRAVPPPPDGRDAFTGRTAVVFGDGAAIADELAACGATVHRYGEARWDDPRAAADALATAAEKSGRIDHVVHVADAPPAGALAALEPGPAAQALGGGCAGALTVARAALPYLRRTRGHLLLCAPPADPAAGPGLHAVTRSAVAALARALAAEWAADGIRVNCVDASPSAPRTALAVLASGLTGEVLGTAG
mgnify:CR=1 FL=1